MFNISRQKRKSQSRGAAVPRSIALWMCILFGLTNVGTLLFWTVTGQLREQDGGMIIMMLVGLLICGSFILAIIQREERW